MPNTASNHTTTDPTDSTNPAENTEDTAFLLSSPLAEQLTKTQTVQVWAETLASFALEYLQAHGVRIWVRKEAHWLLMAEQGHGLTLCPATFHIDADQNSDQHSTDPTLSPTSPFIQGMFARLQFEKIAIDSIGATTDALYTLQQLAAFLELTREGTETREWQQESGRLAKTVEALVRHLGGSLDLAEVLTKTAESAAVALNFERALVTLFSELDENMARSHQVYTYGFREGFREVLSEGIQVGPVTLERLVQRGEAIRFDRGRDANTPLGLALRELAPETAVLAPLSARGKALGLLYVDTRSSGKSASDEDARLVLALAEQASLAIDNARLYALEIRKREGAEALREAGVALVSSLRLSETLSSALKWAAQLFGAEAVAVYELQNDRRNLHIRSALGLSNTYILRARAKIGTGISGQAADQQRAVYVPDVSAINYKGGSRYTRKLIAEGNYPYRSILSLPLITRDGVFGTLTLYWGIASPLNEHLRTLAGVFTAQVSLALENARRYEEELQREKETAILLHLTQLLDQELSGEALHQALNQALEEMITALDGERGLLVLEAFEISKQSEQLESSQAFKPFRPFGTNTDHSSYTHNLSEISQTEIAALKKQLGGGARPLKQRYVLAGASSGLIVPLHINSEEFTNHPTVSDALKSSSPTHQTNTANQNSILGFLYVDSSDPDLPPEYVLQRARKIAHQLAQSLMRKHLLLALEQKEARYRQLTESAHDLILSSDARGIISYANPAAEHLLHCALGHSPVGQSVWSLSGPETEEAWHTALAQALNQDHPTPQMAEIHLGKSEHYRLEVRLTPFASHTSEQFAEHSVNIDTQNNTHANIRTNNEQHGILLVARDLSQLAKLAYEIQARGQELEAATHRQSELRTFLAFFDQAQEEERQRISRELHDDTAQVLVAIGRRMTRLGRQLDGDLAKRAEDIRGDLDEALNSVRRFARNLRPSILDDLGLVAALEWLCQQTQTKSRLELSGTERRLKHVTELAVFRLCQEALNNVDKHAEASSAAIRFHFACDHIQMSICDDGRGIDPVQAATRAKAGHLGLIGLRERVELLSGTFHITSEQDKGTEICFTIPE